MTNAEPEAKHRVLPAHVATARTACSILVYVPSRVDGGTVDLRLDSLASRSFDLLQIASLQVISHIRKWSTIRRNRSLALCDLETIKYVQRTCDYEDLAIQDAVEDEVGAARTKKKENLVGLF